GLPYAITLSGISFVTTLPAPITTLSPMVTPGIITDEPPTQTLLPIVTGAVCVLQNSNEQSSFGHPKLSIVFVGLNAVYIFTFVSIFVSSPFVHNFLSYSY